MTSKKPSTTTTTLHITTTGHGPHGEELAHTIQQLLHKSFTKNDNNSERLDLPDLFTTLDVQIRSNQYQTNGNNSSTNFLSKIIPIGAGTVISGEERYRTSGTSISMVQMNATNITLVNVGTNQIFLYNHSNKNLQSFPSLYHNPNMNSVEAIRVKNAGAWIDPKDGFINGQTLSSRSIGDYALKRMSPIIIPTPEIISLKRSISDQYLLILSHDVMKCFPKQEEIEEIFQNISGMTSSSTIEQEIIKRAIHHGCTSIDQQGFKISVISLLLPSIMVNPNNNDESTATSVSTITDTNDNYNMIE
jgi:serine/threonine protein phosphatase PrpC